MIVAVREIDGLERGRTHGVRGDDRIRFAATQRRHQFGPAPYLNVAGRGQLEADSAGQVDVEAGEDVVLVEVVEGRIVAVREEADSDALLQRLTILRLGPLIRLGDLRVGVPWHGAQQQQRSNKK
jgi:hypothetical protein